MTQKVSKGRYASSWSKGQLNEARFANAIQYNYGATLKKGTPEQDMHEKCDFIEPDSGYKFQVKSQGKGGEFWIEFVANKGDAGWVRRDTVTHVAFSCEKDEEFIIVEREELRRYTLSYMELIGWSEDGVPIYKAGREEGQLHDRSKWGKKDLITKVGREVLEGIPSYTVMPYAPQDCVNIA